jgi:hypothetical protein
MPVTWTAEASLEAAVRVMRERYPTNVLMSAPYCKKSFERLLSIHDDHSTPGHLDG